MATVKQIIPDLQQINQIYTSKMLNKNDIKSFIQNDILNDAGTDISDDQDLLLTGLLDSMNVIKLATFLENQCDISIPAEDLVIENFGSLNQISGYLIARKADFDTGDNS